MPIEWNKVTWYSQAIAIVLFVAVFALGYRLGQRSMRATPDPLLDDGARILADGTHCFERTQEATDAAPYAVEERIEIAVAGDAVSGMKRGTQAGPDMTNGYEGSLAGTKTGDALDLVFSYTIEGSENSERELYELRGDTLVKMRYPLIEERGMLVPDMSARPSPVAYESVPCGRE